MVIFLIAAVSADDTAMPAPATIAVDSIVVERNIRLPRDFRIHRTFYPLRIGLALSGGGARGIAQIGVLKAFDDAGMEISCIAGSSMGSIIGGLYASGYRADEIEEEIRKVDFSSIFSDSPQRRSLFMTQREEQDRYLFSVRFDGIKPYIPRALTVGQRLTAYLTDLTIRADYGCAGDFDYLTIPYRAVATDIGDGSKAVLKSGNLADAMRASIAFPLAFTPVEVDGRYLMDGGIVDPIPVNVCRRMGADYVIAVNTVSPLLPVEQIDNPVEIANQVTTIMTQDALAEQLRGADYILTPLIDKLESYDFTMIDTLIERGYEAGVRAVQAVRSFSSTQADEGQLRISGVETVREDRFLANLKNHFPVRPGQSIKPGDIREALLFADREMKFHRITAYLVPAGEGVIIRIDGETNLPGNSIVYKFNGNKVLPDSVMIPYFPADDDPLSLIEVKNATDAIIALLHRRGFDLAHIRTIEYDHDQGQVEISLGEGYLDFVDIRGNRRTRSWIIKANYPLRPGEPFDVRKSDDGLANIFGTGFFEHVGFDISPTANGVHLVIDVKEKKFTQVRFSAHWDDEYQSEMLTELLDDNVFGAGIQVLGNAQIGSRRNKYGLSLKANRMSRTLITARTRFYFSRLRRRLFQDDGGLDGYRIEDRLGWSVLVGQQIARLGVIDFKYRLEDINTRLTMTGEEKEHVLSSFTIKSTVETYNKYPYPDYGHRQDVAIEFSGKWLGGTFEEYTKIFGSLEGYAPIGNYLNVHPRVAAGISTANLPDIEKYYIGGMYNFSGYRTDQLYGDKFFVANLQLRIKFPYRVYLIGNFDYGNVFGDYESIKISEFHEGWGGAISIDTPFGPFDFGAGKADGTAWRLYLNVGLSF